MSIHERKPLPTTDDNGNLFSEELIEDRMFLLASIVEVFG